MRTCAIIPSYNHCRVVGDIVRRLRDAGLPVFLIDDGSVEPARSILAALEDGAAGVVVLRSEINQGKGAAMMRGFAAASAAGFTHALQIDADGQHDLDSLPNLLSLSASHPDAVISGQPIYDASVPPARKFGHWFTNAWICLETLSLRVGDGMCGFRIYPLKAVENVMAAGPLARRMEFDIDILVRLAWSGTPVRTAPVKVIYPPGNISNFEMVADNWRITKLHTMLVLTMLPRFASIVARRPAEPRETASHWAALRERGAYWGLRFCAIVYRLVGRAGCQAFLIPIVLYFYLLGAGSEQRNASRIFLSRVFGRPSTMREGFRHFLSFATRALDTFIAWNGGIKADAVDIPDRAVLDAAASDPRGAVIVIAHLGNVDLARALLDTKTRERITLLVHTRHALHYNRILREFRPEAEISMIQVTEIGPETAILLSEQVESGKWVVIAGDRTPVLSQGRVSQATFLGASAPFSHGPWILGAILDCPVYLMFCLRRGPRFELTMERFADRIALPRSAREEALQDHVNRYASRLEHYARADPFQWYNFFDFWAH